jgi:two-component system, LytTR family, sensor histidine kinase AlgZ
VNDRARLALYGGGAVALAAFTVSAFFLSRSMPVVLALGLSVPPAILFGFIGLAARYPCRAMPLRSTSVMRLIAAHAGGAAVASGVWVLSWQWWLSTIDRTLTDIALVFGTGAVLYGGTVVIHYLMLELDASLRYQVLMREAELKAFKAQVDPHFLFNSLNAVASLCGSRPNEAREMAQLMADFFRQTLKVGALDRITLEQELDLVSRYLAIEKVRFGSRLLVNMSVDDAAKSAEVPPLLLQPLVENAVRHGIASMVEGGTVDVAATRSNGVLKIRIENPADPDRVQVRGEGIGLSNARGRLSAISNNRAQFRTREADGRFTVEMEMPA